MPQIRLLPDQVANQIAAGEVIERPASVIKELVENSIDAGATRVEVEFKKGGVSYMRIEDNGCGMNKNDALLCLERHATSKIRSAQDLDSLSTMGFRGEALPSIASVSRFQLQSREHDAEGGTEVLVNAGKVCHVRDCGMPPGTRMQISHLFNSVPARRKFLKSQATESAHIIHQTRLYALAHPEVAFALIDDGRTVFKSPACEHLRDRVAEIFGKQIAGNLLEVEAEEGEYRLTGLIGKPGVSRSSRHEMLVYVNRRPVESRTLAYALVESYYGHIPKGRYPVAFLFLELPPHLIDVNVHPAKREIRFRNEAQARGFAVRTILETVKESVSPPAVRSIAAQPTNARVVETSVSNAPRRILQTRKKEAARIDTPLIAEPKERPPEMPRKPEIDASQSADTERSPEPDSAGRLTANEQWRFIGWAQSDFAIYDTKSGIVLLNARAAQQRIWFERLLRQFENQSVQSQSLLLPVPIEMDPVSSVILNDNVGFLEEHGIRVSPFGRNFYRIEGAPTWLEESEIEGFVREIVSMLRQGSISDRKAALARESIARHAALKAIRLKERPSDSELEMLLESLFACSNPLADAEGRPSFIELSRGELDRRFERSRRASLQSEMF